MNFQIAPVENTRHALLGMTYARPAAPVTNYASLSERRFRSAEHCSKIHTTSLDPDGHGSSGHFQEEDKFVGLKQSLARRPVCGKSGRV